MSYNPLPQSLASECKKAAKILREFTMPSAKSGPDKLIPKSLLARAKGLAIITVVRVGFFFTMRGGSGLIVARLPEGGWSAPTLIGLGGLGGGIEFGGEITNFVIVLNTPHAIKSFAINGQVSLGGSLSVAAGPLGRNAAADVALRKPAAFFTYSRTRGLYVGITIEGSVMVERRGANKKVYGADVRAKQLLTGMYDQPAEAAILYSALDAMTGGKYGEAAHQIYDAATGNGGAPRRPTISGMKKGLGSVKNKITKKKDGGDNSAAPKKSSSGKSWRDKLPSKPSMPSIASGSGSKREVETYATVGVAPSAFGQQGERSKVPRNRVARQLMEEKARAQMEEKSAYDAYRDKNRERERPAEPMTWDDDEGELKVRALFDFEGTMDCDLSFRKNAQITVLTRTSSQDDWWEGQIFDRVGIFPANFVEVL